MNRARTVVTVAAAVFAVSAVLAAAATATVPSGDAEPQVGAGEHVDEDTDVLEVEPGHERLELGPGESDEVTVEVSNEEQDGAVEVEPEVVEVEDEFPSDWVEVTAEGDEVGAGETVEVDVEVEVPDDAEAERHAAFVGFTDDRVATPTAGTFPLNAFQLTVNVDLEPTVEVDADYESVQTPSGETHEFEYEVTNEGDEAVPVAPEYDDEQAEMHADSGDMYSAFPSENIGLDAPDEVASGETETVTVEVETPEDLSGTYMLPVDLGVDDPARTGDHWRTVRVHLDVWKQDGEPVSVEFDVDDSDSFEFEASVDEVESLDAPEIDVTLYGPDGDEVTGDTETVTKLSSSVSLGDDPRDTTPEHAVVQTVEEPDDGTWTAEVEVSNAPRFGYEVRQFE